MPRGLLQGILTEISFVTAMQSVKEESERLTALSGTAGGP